MNRMIAVNKASGYNECFLCSSQEDMREIMFSRKMSYNGTALVLCKECRKALHDILEKDSEYNDLHLSETRKGEDYETCAQAT